MSEFTCIDKMIYIINTPTGLGYNTLRLVFSADQARECLRDGMSVQAANQQGEIVAEFGYGMYPLQVVQQTLFAFDAFHAAAAEEAPAEETSVDICEANEVIDEQPCESGSLLKRGYEKHLKNAHGDGYEPMTWAEWVDEFGPDEPEGNE